MDYSKIVTDTVALAKTIEDGIEHVDRVNRCMALAHPLAVLMDNLRDDVSEDEAEELRLARDAMMLASNRKERELQPPQSS